MRDQRKKGNLGYERQFDPDSECKLSKKRAIKIVQSIWNEYTNRFRIEAKRRTSQKAARLDPGNSDLIERAIKHEGYKASKNENSINFLRREIYALGLSIKRNPHEMWTAADLVTELRVNKTTHPDKLDNVFHALFMTVFKEDDGLSRQARWKLGKEAEYGYRHQVEPELLCGFLYQSGDTNELPRKLKKGYEEPAFRQKLAEYRQDHASSEDNEASEDDEPYHSLPVR